MVDEADTGPMVLGGLFASLDELELELGGVLGVDEGLGLALASG